MSVPQPIVIFGTGPIANVVACYIIRNRTHFICAYTVDKKHAKTTEFPFESIQKHYLPENHSMLIVTGYSHMNALRERKYNEAKEMGYKFANYIDPTAIVSSEAIIGNNVIISPRVIIEPFAKIGNGVIIRPQAMVGHDAVIDDFSWIAAHSVIGSMSTIGRRSFIGYNAVVRDKIKIAEQTLVGACAFISKDTQPHEVYFAPHATLSSRKSYEVEI